MSSGRTPGLARNTAVGPPGAAWISAKTTTETMSRSGTAVARRRRMASAAGPDRMRLSLSRGFELPLLHVPERSRIGGIALEAFQRRGHGVELGDVVERNLNRQFGDPNLRLAQEVLPFRAVNRSIGRVDEPC